MARLLLSILLVSSASALFGLDWTAPTECPPLREIFSDADFTKLRNELRAPIDAKFDAVRALPEHGCKIVEVFEGAQAAKLGIRTGDFVLMLDRAVIESAGELSGRLEASAAQEKRTLMVQSPGKNPRAVILEAGRVGIRISDIERDIPPDIVATYDPKWSDDLDTLQRLQTIHPEIAEQSLARAFKAGCPSTPDLERLALELLIAQGRFDDALKRGWLALAQPGSQMLAPLFAQAALGSGHAEAIVAASVKYERAFDQNKLKEWVRGAKDWMAPDPGPLPAGLFPDSLLLRAESHVPGMETGAPRLKNLCVYGGSEEYSAGADSFDSTSFTPEFKNGRIKCRFFVRSRGTEKPIIIPYRFFSIGIINFTRDAALAEKRTFSMYRRNPRTNEDEIVPTLAGALGCIDEASFAVAIGDDTVRIQTFAPTGPIVLRPTSFVRDYKTPHTLELTVWQGWATVVLDDKTVYRGQLGASAEHLGIMLSTHGMSGYISRFSAHELLSDAEFDARVKPAVNQAFRLDHTRLHDACDNDDSASIQRLLNAGADPMQLDANLETPVHTALRSATIEKAKLLLGNREPDFLMAACFGNLDRVKVLLAENPNLIRTALPWSALHGAARFGQKEVADFLVKQGANVNASTSYLMNCNAPLHWATKGQPGMAEFLLQHGANAGQLDRLGYDALKVAEWRKSAEVIEILRKHAAAAPPAAPQPAVKPPAPPALEF